MELHRAIIYTTEMSKQVTKCHVRDAVHMYPVNWGAGLTLQIHTLPDHTPIPTIVPQTDEHNGRYSDGTHSILLPACLIHMPSEPKLVPVYKGRTGSAMPLMLETSKLRISMVSVSVWM
jgi:hypothetical protein